MATNICIKLLTRLKMRKTFLLLSILISIYSYSQERLEIKLQKNENWWAGIIDHGHLMPLHADFRFDLIEADTYNQLQPLLI